MGFGFKDGDPTVSIPSKEGLIAGMAAGVILFVGISLDGVFDPANDNGGPGDDDDFWKRLRDLLNPPPSPG